LEGSVRKAGNRVRITAQLIDTVTEGHLWAQNYDRQLEDVFAIQSEIAEKVAGELRVRLVDSERKAIEKKPTENTEAYTNYLQAREMVREQSEISLERAPEVFEKAIALDPTFAKAYVGLAECYVVATNAGYLSYEQATPKAELAARKGVQLDPELAEAHATLAIVAFAEDDVRGGEANARRAIELNPSLSEAHFVLSNIYLLKGEKEKGAEAVEACYRLDRVRPRNIGA
jgi:adenylate cyclase